MNFKKNAVPPIKKPLFPGYSSEYMMPEHPKRSVSLLTLFIVIICTFVIAFLLFKNFDRISNRFSASIESSTGFEIGQNIMISGEIKNNGDLIIYTHTLTMADATVVGLKSRTLDLNMYTGVVELQGTIEREYNDLFIVEVTAISGTLAGTGAMVDTEVTEGSGTYITQAGIYLPPEFMKQYVLLNQGENGVLKVQRITNNQIILISYFVCKPNDPNKNCVQLKQNIGSSAEKVVTTSYGDKLYKLEGVTSWFFTNGNLYGYFINDIPDQEVIDLVNAIVLPTETYIKNTFIDKIQQLCTDGTTSLMQIQNQSLSVDINGLVMHLEGPTADGLAKCKVFIDPSQAAGGTKISYVTNTSTVSTTMTTPTVSDLDVSVKQFPINLEKTLTFTSSRGYSIVFPSSNISYESVNVDESLDLPGVRCSTRMDVIKYSDKAMIHDMPTVSIYTCNIKGTLNNLGNSIIQKEATNGMKFLIKINDAAWMDFANNIQIN